MNKYVLKINGLYDQILSAAIGRNEQKKLNRFINRDPSKYEAYSKDKAEEWLKRWSVLGKTDKVFYRYYSRFVGDDINILPDDLMHNVIEPLLNPMRFRGLYADKNMFDKLLKPYFKEKVTPKSIVRCINGGLYDENYYLMNNADVIKTFRSSEASFVVAKPSIDTSSGHNVLFFDREGEGRYLLRASGEEMTIGLLYELLGSNYIVQEGLLQSDIMKQFNTTSVNTLRINTYKSVNDEKTVALNGVIRIGQVGSNVDNLHAGGCMVGINSDGHLNNFCSDQNGNVFSEFNGIDFSKQEFVIPNFDQVTTFACNVASCLPHQRILALDIMLDHNNEPKLIEYNNCAFSVWVFQQTIGTVFGQFTNEVIDYCKEHKEEATRIYMTY